jgi:hypothetical protein
MLKRGSIHCLVSSCFSGKNVLVSRSSIGSGHAIAQVGPGLGALTYVYFSMSR